ncbi:SPNS3 family protein [Megaselia abdita]
MSSRNLDQYKVYNPLSVTVMDNNSVTDSGGSGSGGMPSTHSSQQLMPPDNSPTVSVTAPRSGITKMQWFTVIVLCFVNLINYMDRFTIAGVLTDIQTHFEIQDSEGGLLQTVFVLSYMIFAPLFGYLGDRYSRTWIMAVGVALWSATTVLGSFMNSFGWFMTFRALVGIGEASYSTIAPTIISDMFVRDVRSKMLALFYFAIPVGSGLGYIVGSETATMFGNWRWALRVTPFLGAIAVILIFLIKDPERGESEGSHHMESSSYTEDIKDLMKNRSFMLSTCGFTCVAFVAGALAWWGPKFIHSGLVMQPGNEKLKLNDVSFKFGAISMVAGLIGVPMGSYISQALIKRFPTIDPLLCAFGLLLSVPLLAGAMLVVSYNATAAYTLVFFGELALNLNWAIVADILLYVVIPTRRSTAEAFQILISHAFGDAGSPYLVGAFSDLIRNSLKAKMHVDAETMSGVALQSLSQTLEGFNVTSTTLSPEVPFMDSDKIKFEALQYALFSTSFVEILGAVFFFVTAAFIINDKRKATQAVAESTNVNVEDLS